MPLGLVRTGHFSFASGFHGDTRLELDELFFDAPVAHRLAGALAAELAGYDAAVVCGPLVGGAFAAQTVATILSARFAYADPAADYAISCGEQLRGRTVIVVDDAINAGTAVLATAARLREAGADVVAVGTLIACAPTGARAGEELGVPQHSVVSVDTALWPASACPHCRAGLPAEPG